MDQTAIERARNRLRRNSPPTEHLPERVKRERNRILAALGDDWPKAVMATVGRWAFDYAILLASLAAVQAWRPGAQLASSATALSLLALVAAGYFLPRMASTLPRTLAIGLLVGWGAIATACDRAPELGWADAASGVGPVLAGAALTVDLLEHRRRRGQRSWGPLSRPALIVVGLGLAALVLLLGAAWPAEEYAGAWAPIATPLALRDEPAEAEHHRRFQSRHEERATSRPISMPGIVMTSGMIW